MGKMKELFMQINYPFGYDEEREHLMNDFLAKSYEYEEYEKLKQDPEMNITNTKIEVANVTRIQVGQEVKTTNPEFERT